MQLKAAVIWLVAACGGKTTGDRVGSVVNTSGGASGAAGAASVAGRGATSGPDAGLASEGGTSSMPTRLCNAWVETLCIEGDSCTCRDHPEPACQSTMTCQGGAWKLALGGCAPPSDPTPCPETALLARDTPCWPNEAECHYPGAVACYCQEPFDVDALLCQERNSNGRGPVPLLWYCGQETANCPVGVPDIGSPCTEDGLLCGDPCAGPYARRCTAGAWELARPQTECV
jgi:hypothetical protein